ncbi:MAG: HD domain-containing protein [Clostridiales bacterium]|nr:HD domain-containing protein [Clostridiales bacterium]MDO4350309.1 HD domain-containing protein [Eubacteriales bacterium]MDY4009963.1 HD domain-containing protein [Candidatus Limiplasma sp.]
MELLDELAFAMIAFDAGDARRIQHFLKVRSLARLIALKEGMDGEARFVLEAAALTHDIGIHPAERKYGRCTGKLQEQEGPPCARELMERLGFEAAAIDRVCWLIAHHHTYEGIESMDHRVLVEADFLVNLYEDGASKEAAQAALRGVFRTAAGKALCREMFAIPTDGGE